MVPGNVVGKTGSELCGRFQTDNMIDDNQTETFCGQPKLFYYFPSAKHCEVEGGHVIKYILNLVKVDLSPIA